MTDSHYTPRKHYDHTSADDLAAQSADEAFNNGKWEVFTDTASTSDTENDDFVITHNGVHPEALSDSETNPASESTKRALLDLISEKAEGGTVTKDTKVTKTLKFARPEKGTLTVIEYLDGESKEGLGKLGQIHRIEWPGKLYGEQLVTNYIIRNSPDGLQIEKHSHTTDPSKEHLGADATIEDAARAAKRGLARIAQMRESQIQEDELGLSFVSEAEARELLALTREAQNIKGS